ncbi:MAG: hypothetical protein DI539_30530, partial [Flavobacterium psychrophilum]
GNYTDRNLSTWLKNHIIKSEGFKESSYYATAEEQRRGQVTIGCGTSYLYLGNGKPYNNGYSYGKYVNGGNGVKPGDTLSSLKVKMGYPNLTSKQFAEQLVINYILGDGVSTFLFLNVFQKNNVPYNELVKDVLLEWAYGSGSVHKFAPQKQGFTLLVNALRNGDKMAIASAYAYWRYTYYKENTVSGQWAVSKYGWMARVYSCAMHILSKEITNSLLVLGYNSSNKLLSNTNYELVFKRDLGIQIKM